VLLDYGHFGEREGIGGGRLVVRRGRRSGCWCCGCGLVERRKGGGGRWSSRWVGDVGGVGLDDVVGLEL